MKNRIFAASKATPATNPKLNKAAIRAMTKNKIAKRNMSLSSRASPCSATRVAARRPPRAEALALQVAALAALLCTRRAMRRRAPVHAGPTTPQRQAAEPAVRIDRDGPADAFQQVRVAVIVPVGERQLHVNAVAIR